MMLKLKENIIRERDYPTKRARETDRKGEKGGKTKHQVNTNERQRKRETGSLEARKEINKDR